MIELVLRSQLIRLILKFITYGSHNFMKLNCLKQINLAVKLNNPVCFICTIDVEIKNNMSPRGSTDRATGAIIAAG